MHMDFIKRLMSGLFNRNHVHNVIAIADNGPDWSVKGILNFIIYGSLWQCLRLDTLVIQSYAPGHSRFNPIERTWSLLSKLIVGVILPVEIEELDFQTPKPNENEKWNKVMDNAIECLRKFWHGKKYDGFPINIHSFTSRNAAIASLKLIHDTLTGFNEVAGAGRKKLRANNEYRKLIDQYQFYVKHANRKAYQLEFIRCDDNPTCSHCTSLPTRDNPFLRLIKNFGGSLPTPIKSDFVKGHFQSLEDMLIRNTSSITKIKRDVRSSTGHGICPYAGCNYAFFSDADKKRHFFLMNHAEKDALRRNVGCLLDAKVKRKSSTVQKNKPVKRKK